jgi:hypothetical protein
MVVLKVATCVRQTAMARLTTKDNTAHLRFTDRALVRERN